MWVAVKKDFHKIQTFGLHSKLFLICCILDNDVLKPLSNSQSYLPLYTQYWAGGWPFYKYSIHFIYSHSQAWGMPLTSHPQHEWNNDGGKSSGRCQSQAENRSQPQQHWNENAPLVPNNGLHRFTELQKSEWKCLEFKGDAASNWEVRAQNEIIEHISQYQIQLGSIAEGTQSYFNVF